MKTKRRTIQPPYIWIEVDGKIKPIATFLWSTLLTCFLLTFFPWLTPVLCESAAYVYLGGGD